jgi:peptidoglycan/xylan/chitin deacetylase (PgdA/CDA1 family)
MERAHGIMLHHFWDDRHPIGQGAISGDEFARMLDWLDPSRILPAEVWLKHVRDGTLQDHHLCLTFDDALRCQYDVALPVLQHYGLTAFWFVYSSVFEGGIEPLEVFRYFRTAAFSDINAFYSAFDLAVEDSAYDEFVKSADASVDYSRHLAEFELYSLPDRRFRYLRDRILGPDAYNEVMWKMIKDSGWSDRISTSLLWMDDACLTSLSAQGHLVGLHSYSHPTVLADLSADAQRSEYDRNARHLRRCLGKAPICMSHPCNSYNAETLAILGDMKIELGFRSNMVKLDSGPLEMPRRDHANVMSEMSRA